MDFSTTPIPFISLNSLYNSARVFKLLALLSIFTNILWPPKRRNRASAFKQKTKFYSRFINYFLSTLEVS